MSINEALKFIESFERDAQEIEDRIVEGDQQAEDEEEKLDWAKYDAMQDIANGI